MKIIIKGLKGLKLQQNEKDYIKEKMTKFAPLVEEPSICEVTVAERSKGSKRGIDENIHIKLTVPKAKKPIFAKASSNDLFAAVDIVQDCVEDQLIKYKDKRIGSRFPLKYWVSKTLETGASGPRWVIKKLRRKK